MSYELPPAANDDCYDPKRESLQHALGQVYMHAFATIVAQGHSADNLARLKQDLEQLPATEIAQLCHEISEQQNDLPAESSSDFLQMTHALLERKCNAVYENFGIKLSFEAIHAIEVQHLFLEAFRLLHHLIIIELKEEKPTPDFIARKTMKACRENCLELFKDMSGLADSQARVIFNRFEAQLREETLQTLQEYGISCGQTALR